MIKKAHSTRRPSKLETLLAMSIKFAKLQRRVADLEAEVLRLSRSQLFSGPRSLAHEMRPEFQ